MITSIDVLLFSNPHLLFSISTFTSFLFFSYCLLGLSIPPHIHTTSGLGMFAFYNNVSHNCDLLLISPHSLPFLTVHQKQLKNKYHFLLVDKYHGEPRKILTNSHNCILLKWTLCICYYTCCNMSNYYHNINYPFNQMVLTVLNCPQIQPNHGGDTCRACLDLLIREGSVRLFPHYLEGKQLDSGIGLAHVWKI